MKVISCLSLLAVYALPALSQMVSIAAPAPGSTLAPGSTFVVELDSSDGLTNFLDISVAIGILPGNAGAGEVLGDLLYAGGFSPARHNNARAAYQNFSVTIPSTFATGDSTLNVAHFYLIGADLQPTLEMKNISLVISN